MTTARGADGANRWCPPATVKSLPRPADRVRPLASRRHRTEPHPVRVVRVDFRNHNRLPIPLLSIRQRAAAPPPPSPSTSARQRAASVLVFPIQSHLTFKNASPSPSGVFVFPTSVFDPSPPSRPQVITISYAAGAEGSR
uniref:Uncharacterized protein n=1 Tax=Plectus sambesii TaxID=2011161 RepID=A0A914VV77_9BILA